MKIKHIIEIETEVTSEMYPEGVETKGQIVLFELTNIDYKHIINQIVNDNCNIKIESIPDEETF